MKAIVPLPCWPFPPKPEQVKAIKAAKDALCKRDGLEFGLQLAPAVPGSPGRVMAFAPPPFLCEAAIVRSLEVDRMAEYLEHCLDDSTDASRGLTWEAWLTATLNVPVREVTHQYSGADMFAMEVAREEAKERGVRFDDGY